MNAYGFAGGDPVNVSVPLGLASCPVGEKCLGEELLNAAKQTAANFIDGAINVFGSLGNSLRSALPGLSVDVEPSATEVFDAEAYRKMFNDWGWSSKNEARPHWMT